MSIADEFTRDELTAMFRFLDGLRLSGVVNMFGSAQFLETRFGLDEEVARAVLTGWMVTFGDGKAQPLERVAGIEGSE